MDFSAFDERAKALTDEERAEYEALKAELAQALAEKQQKAAEMKAQLKKTRLRHFADLSQKGGDPKLSDALLQQIAADDEDRTAEDDKKTTKTEVIKW